VKKGVSHKGNVKDNRFEPILAGDKGYSAINSNGGREWQTILWKICWTGTVH